jgi:hypothetical protein
MLQTEVPVGVSARLFAARSKLLPKKYGDRVDVSALNTGLSETIRAKGLVQVSIHQPDAGVFRRGNRMSQDLTAAKSLSDVFFGRL